MMLTGDEKKNLSNTRDIISRYVIKGVLERNDLCQFDKIISTLESASDGLVRGKCEYIGGGVVEEGNSEFENDYEYIMLNKRIIIIKYVGFDKKEIIIPDTFKGTPIIGIGAQAFQKQKGLETIILGKNIQYIGEYAFEDCKQLVSIQWNEDLLVIGEYAFAHTGLQTVKIPENVVYIGDFAFYESSCRSVVLPTQLNAIEPCVFSGCKQLESVRMPYSLYRIGWAAFSDCDKLQNIQLNEGLTIIEKWAFQNCKKLNEIDLPNSVKEFGDDIFKETYIFQPDLRYNPRTLYRNLRKR